VPSQPWLPSLYADACTGTEHMSLKNLSRRLERLESRLLPDVGEARVLTLYFVSSGDRRVVDQMHIQLPPVPKKLRRWRTR
jgi:hypothetical protein